MALVGFKVKTDDLKSRRDGRRLAVSGGAEPSDDEYDKYSESGLFRKVNLRGKGERSK